jgi:hypothetical protein
VALRINKPWRARSEAAQVPGQLGVFQLANAAGEILYIGVADARSLFGLRSAIADGFTMVEGATCFRFESTSAYHTRYRELLMVYQADHGGLPRANPAMKLGTLHP